MSMRAEQDIEFPVCGALRTFRAIEAVQQLFHSENNLVKKSWVEQFFQTYGAEISELAREIFPRWLPKRDIDLIRRKGVRAALADFPRKELPNASEYGREIHLTGQAWHDGFVSAKRSDLLRMYGLLEAIIDLEDTQKYKEVQELVRFGQEYYPELHALYYLAFCNWFSPHDTEIIEEEGVDALLDDYPLPKCAHLPLGGGKTFKGKIRGNDIRIKYGISGTDPKVKESSDDKAVAKKVATRKTTAGGAKTPKMSDGKKPIRKKPNASGKNSGAH